MDDALKIAVIGGGLIGLSTADSLIHRGAKVTLYERNAAIGNGAGRYNSGMIHPSQAAPWFYDDKNLQLTRTLRRWANESRELLMRRRKILECEDISRSSGTIQIFENQQLVQSAQNFYQNIGVPSREYRGKWAFGYHALEFPDDESGNAFHYCQKLGADLERRGCDIRKSAPARVIKQAQTLCIKAGSQSQQFDRVVVAAGAASSMILDTLGVDLPVSPMRGHALVFNRPKCILPDIPIMHAKSHSALTVFDDHVRLSGTVGENEPQALIKVWEEVAPEIVESLGVPLFEWSADRPYSEIGRPIIGPTSVPHLWVNSGHGHMGWSLCTWSGDMLARMMMAGEREESLVTQIATI